MEIDSVRVFDVPVPVPGFSTAGYMRDSHGGERPSTLDHTEAGSNDDRRLAEFVRAAEQYRSQLLWVATRMTSRSEEAEDIVQYALLRAYVNLSKFRGESKMTTWLRAIVHNTALEYLRNQHGKRFVPLECTPFQDGECEDFNLPDPSMNPEERYEQCERKEIVLDAVGRMDPGGRRVLEMCVFEELPYIQVATFLNVSLSTVKSRMFRNRRFLRAAISIDENSLG